MDTLIFKIGTQWSIDNGANWNNGEIPDWAKGVAIERNIYTDSMTTEQRTCATCHAVLADGPQPYATYVENKDSLENNLITLQNKYNQVVSIALSNGVILPPELTFDIKVEYDAELLALLQKLEDVVNYMNNDRNEDGILVEKAVKYLKVLMVRQ